MIRGQDRSGSWSGAVSQLLIWVYVAGVVWGLLRIDARPAARVALALVWPIGPAAFVVTLTVLLAALLIAFPRFGAVVLALAAAAVAWWALS
jgi:hypothetical protein